MCGHLMAPRVARAGLPNLQRHPFWAAVSSDKLKLQQGFSVHKSRWTAVVVRPDIPLLRRRSHHRLGIAEAQASFSSLNDLLGTPFAEEKRQPMHRRRGINLRLDFDFSAIPESRGEKFWVRNRLQSKNAGMLEVAEASGTLTPEMASKLFLEQGIYGRIGAGGLAALKDRQQERDTAITAALQTCFDTARALLKLKPQRMVEVLPAACARFVAASDAAEDTPGQGTGESLLVWKDSLEVREAFEAVITLELYRLFTPGRHKIAQLELSMVLLSIINRPDRFRGRRGPFYIDNLAALMALIRGRSDSPDLEHLARIIHAALFSWHTWILWEWVPSKSNWTDAISRLGRDDPRHRGNGFRYFQAHFPLLLWHLPLPAVIRTFGMCECFGEKCNGICPHLVTSGGGPG